MFLLSTSLSHAPYERLHGKDKRICTAHWVIAPHDSFATSGMRHALAVDNAKGLYGHERRTLLRGTGFPVDCGVHNTTRASWPRMRQVLKGSRQGHT